MKNYTLRNALFLVCFFMISWNAKATHIVGGELNYRYLTNNFYQIKLTVYRDCFNGIPPFDNPASIGVFDANNNLITEMLMTYTGSDTIPPTINSPCFIPPTNICYEVTTYIDTIQLPPIPGGYQLAYQRCCRNQTNAHVLLTMNGRTIAEISIQETIKEDAAQAISYFNHRHIKTTLLSGDHPQKVKTVQEKLDLVEALAEQSPEQKLNYLDQVQQSELVAMVGDGINDAPALQKAAVGIALNDASKIAMQSAKIIIMEKNLSKLVWGHQVSRLTLSTIKENLFWAFGYNVVAIPVAAMGLLNPMWGAAFMAFSDLVVIRNSLRLRLRKVEKG